MIATKKKTVKVKKVKGTKVSKPKMKYEIIKLAKLPDEVLNKIKEGSRDTEANSYRYYGEAGRMRRYFDWANEICKVIAEIKSLDYGIVRLAEERIPVQYHCYLQALQDAHRIIKRELYGVEEKASWIRRSLYYSEGDRLNITKEEMGYKE